MKSGEASLRLSHSNIISISLEILVVAPFGNFISTRLFISGELFISSKLFISIFTRHSDHKGFTLDDSNKRVLSSLGP